MCGTIKSLTMKATFLGSVLRRSLRQLSYYWWSTPRYRLKSVLSLPILIRRGCQVGPGIAQNRQVDRTTTVLSFVASDHLIATIQRNMTSPAHQWSPAGLSTNRDRKST